MKREITQLLLDWKLRKNRKPLLLRGARQVGKTFVVEQFANEYFENYVKVNPEEKPELKSLFKEKSPESIIRELSVLFNIDIKSGKTLLFIDEIQSCPEAIVSLRYFYEKLPDLHVIAAGSLLDHTLNEMKLSMPVGRIEFIHVHPMNFREFLWALSETRLSEYLENFSFETGIIEAVHKKLLEYLKYYMYVGGMPEAVKVYAESGNLIEVERVHNSIITSLQYDFAKYGNRNQLLHLTSVFRYTGQHPMNRLKYVKIDKEVRSTYLKEAVQKLEMSRILHLVKHTASPGIPLTKYIKDDVYKTLFLDVGLANSISKIQLIDPVNILNINEGAMAEQFVGQELLTLQPAYQEPSLFYWEKEGKNVSAEIDFLFQHKNVVYPVEVKAGKKGTLKSLHSYLYEKKIKTGIRFNTDMPSVGTFSTKVRVGNNYEELEYKLISLPLYMIQQLPGIIDSEEQ